MKREFEKKMSRNGWRTGTMLAEKREKGYKIMPRKHQQRRENKICN